MLKRSIGAALVLSLAGVAAGAQAPEPEMRVRAESMTAAGQNVVRVGGQAPLPDGTIVEISLFYGNAVLHEARVAAKRVAMKGGAFGGELAGDVSRFFPGDYLVHVAVDDNQPPNLRRRLAPPLRRLEGRFRVTVGDPLQVCAAVNAMTGRLVSVSRAIHRIYPELNALLERAWNKKLSGSEWTSWQPRTALEQTREQLTALVCNRGGVGRVLPKSISQALNLNTELVGMCRSIDDILKGFVQDNDNLVKPKQGPAAQNPPSIMDLHETMHREGIAFYAATARRVYDEIQTHYAQRSGKGAGNWDALATGWGRSVQKIGSLADDFDRLEWITEKMDRPVRLKEALLGVKEYAEACGRVLRGEADEATAELARRREAIRTQVEGLMR